LWQEKKEEMSVDFDYHQYDNMITMFDDNIEECEVIDDETERNATIASYRTYKQKAQTHFRKAKKYLRN